MMLKMCAQPFLKGTLNRAFFKMEILMKIYKVEPLYMLITHLQQYKHMASLVSAVSSPVLIIFLKKKPSISFSS